MELLMHFLKGYVRIWVYGYSPERFLNLCANRGIFLWDIEKQEEGYILCLHKKAFFALKPIVKKTGTRVRVLHRYGLPFLFPGIRRRWLFVAGFFLTFIFWMIASFFVWSVHVEGNLMLTDDVVEDYLKKQGVYVSMPKKQLHIAELEKNIREEFPQIIWTSLQLDGTRLTVYVKENQYYGQEQQPEEEVTEFPHGADLVADMDATVVSIITRTGTPQVKAGDVVEKGQILVGGQVTILGDDETVKGVRYYKADADVILQGVVPFQISQPYEYTEKVFSGRNTRKRFLQIGTREILLGLPGNPYLCGDIITEKKRITLMKGVTFPIYYGHSQYFEYVPTESRYTDSQMKEKLSGSFDKFMETLQEKGVQIIAKDVKIKKTETVGILEAELAVQKKADTLQAIIPAADEESIGTVSLEDNGE